MTPHTRILVVAPQPFYEDRGTPIAVRQLLQALSEQGAEVDLLTFPVGTDVELPGLKIHRVGQALGIRHVPIGLSRRKLLLDAILIPRLVRMLGSGRYHHVHAVEEAVFPAVVLGALFNVPVVYDMQSSLPEQLMRQRIFRPRLLTALLRRFEHWAIRRSTAVVCSSGLQPHVYAIDPGASVHEWRFANESVPAPADSVERLRHELSLPRGTPTVLYAGNFEPYQGLDILIDAMPAVLDRVPTARFVLVGASPDGEPALPAAAAAIASRGALRIVPRRPRDELGAYLALADVLVCPRSEGENLPLKVFDYLAAGKPIVATDAGHHRRVLDESRAVLVPPSPEAMAPAIASLLEDPERARRLGRSALVYAERHLDWPEFSSRVARLIRTVDRENRAA